MQGDFCAKTVYHNLEAWFIKYKHTTSEGKPPGLDNVQKWKVMIQRKKGIIEEQVEGFGWF